MSSSYCYCYCNCYCNRDSYMKCNNNNNNILLHLLLLLLFFAVTVLLHLSFHFTICTLYQHGTLCSPLPFSPLLFFLSLLFYQCMQIPHTPHTVWGKCTATAKLDIITRKLELKKCMQTSREGVLKRERGRKGDRGSA